MFEINVVSLPTENGIGGVMLALCEAGKFLAVEGLLAQMSTNMTSNPFEGCSGDVMAKIWDFTRDAWKHEGLAGRLMCMFFTAKRAVRADKRVVEWFCVNYARFGCAYMREVPWLRDKGARWATKILNAMALAAPRGHVREVLEGYPKLAGYLETRETHEAALFRALMVPPRRLAGCKTAGERVAWRMKIAGYREPPERERR